MGRTGVRIHGNSRGVGDIDAEVVGLCGHQTLGGWGNC